jgi:hydroxyacylglutathione hydrolase
LDDDRLGRHGVELAGDGAEESGDVMEIHTIETPSLGDRSYVVTDGRLAAVIDPQRDIDRVLDLVASRGLTITHVLETHNHNDYVTGGVELARVTGAAYVMSADEELFFPVQGVRDGDELQVGSLTIRVMHTPGHTPTHLSYVATDGTREVVFTGGSLLYGSVGRTDLISRAATEELTRHQFASAHRLADELADETTVLPTHGFGSFCSSAAADEHTTRVDPRYGVETSTIGEQRGANVALATTDVEAFVARLMAGLDAYPRYYAHMASRNKVGPGPVNLEPAVEADPSELTRRIHAGEWVVDLRSRTAYAKDHVTGTVNVEVDTSFITYLAWVVPWGLPVTLIGDTQDEVAEAQRQMVRVGIDRPAAQALGGIDTYGLGLARGAYRVGDLGELAEAQAEGEVRVLDVRRHDERATGGIAGSLHVPLHELERRMDEVPTQGEVWVHCASGYRAAIAASLLARAGRTPVLIDDSDEHLEELGFTLERA